MLGGFHTEVAPLHWWARLDSNQRRINRRIYSAMPLPLGDLSLWWNRPGLNQRRLSFQSGAQPSAKSRFAVASGMLAAARIPTELRFQVG